MPEEIIQIILIAPGTFALTNIDDLLLLSIYFANPSYKKSAIVCGQLAGIMVLTGISLAGLIAGKMLEPAWVGLLGLLPVFLGLKELMLRKRESDTAETSSGLNSSSQLLSVAMVTIANGGDNIGVYTPLFASIQAYLVPVYVLIFILMTLLWCALAFYSLRHPLIRRTFSEYGHAVMPYFLIFLGIWILCESGSVILLRGLW